MREGRRAHLLAIFCTFWSWGLLQIDARNEGSQQTFVVRYKNEENTVPVTVVLDHKKQTEYVINMSPRALTKTVTLYDFKRRTIAYKDLTHRECFLGRLTYETLIEETDALTNVENPVIRRPKVLSLDPQRPSLTPTEIRNMAGQKIAVFCGKMTTWLVLPRETHARPKREAEEIEERTVHRHGYHTVHYSHFGRETRRRYRKPAAGPFIHRRTAANGETTSVRGAELLKSPSLQHPFWDPSPVNGILHENNREVHHPYPSLPTKNEALLHVPGLHPASSTPNWNSGENFSAASPSNSLNGQTLSAASPSNSLNGQTLSPASQPRQNEHELQSSLNPSGIETLNYGTGNKANDFRGKHYSNLTNADISDSTFSNGDATPNFPAVHSVLQNSHIVDRNRQNKRNITLNWNGDQRQSDAEEVSFPFSYDSNASRRNSQSKSPDSNVSSNGLEIQQTSKESENIIPSQIVQTNEDVHDLFEGFFNLRKSDPSSEQLLHNSYSIPKGGREHHDPQGSSSHSKINNITDKMQQWIENESDIAKISVTTNSYSNYNAAPISPAYSDSTVSPANWNSLSDTSTLKYKLGSFDSISQKVSSGSRSRTAESSQDEIILSKTLDKYFTTADPSDATTHSRHSEHRADVSQPNETLENFTSLNFERQNLFHDGISSHLRNVLRNYKPDQIVIDVERIPTQLPPESTLRFQDQKYFPNSNTSSNANASKSEQTSGDTWRGRPISKLSLPSRKTHNVLTESRTSQQNNLQAASKAPQQNNLQTESRASQQLNLQTESRASQQKILQAVPRMSQQNNLRTASRASEQNNLQAASKTSQQHKKQISISRMSGQHNLQTATLRAQQHRNNVTNILQHDNNIRHIYKTPPSTHSDYGPYGLEGLPPGVSIHPRHPKAPYADAVHSRVLPPVAREKPHLQRHHKRKDCCKGRRKAKGCCGSCCRGKSCCPSPKFKQGHRPVPMPAQRKSAEDRCQKEKLCRTLYESTYQVIVCRHATIDGC